MYVGLSVYRLISNGRSSLKTHLFPFVCISRCLMLLQLPPPGPPLPRVRTRSQKVLQSQWWLGSALDLMGCVCVIHFPIYLPGVTIRGSSGAGLFNLILGLWETTPSLYFKQGCPQKKYLMEHMCLSRASCLLWDLKTARLELPSIHCVCVHMCKCVCHSISFSWTVYPVFNPSFVASVFCL